jgi:cytochrome b
VKVTVPVPSTLPAAVGPAGPAPATARARIRAWDAPLRVFHWALVAAVSVAIATGKAGGEWMPLHGRAALAVIGLVVFRVSWGLWGSATARFSHFLPTPTRLRAYWQGRWHGVGHNPLGALSVLALLAILAFQAGTGLFGDDDIAFTGPLAAWVSGDLVQRMTGWHRLMADAVLYWIGLHVAAIGFYTLVKKSVLLRPMLTGWKVVDAAQAPPPAARGGGPLALAVSVLAALAVVFALLAFGLGPP